MIIKIFIITVCASLFALLLVPIYVIKCMRGKDENSKT